MARIIDLKDATVEFRDGTEFTAAVNNVSGYTSGATTMAIDTISRAIPVGIKFTVVGDTVEHTVVSSVGGSTPTSVTFTPGLGASVVDSAVITFGPNVLVIKLGEGNFQYTETRNMEYRRDRGRLDQVREGDEEPLQVTFDMNITSFTAESGDPPTPEDVLKRRGAASTWVTTSADPCDPYCIDIFITIDPDCDNQEPEITVFRQFYYTQLQADFREGTMSVQGSCNVVEAEHERVAA